MEYFDEHDGTATLRITLPKYQLKQVLAFVYTNRNACDARTSSSEAACTRTSSYSLQFPVLGSFEKFV